MYTSRHSPSSRILTLAAVAALLIAPLAEAQKPIKPGFNLFSKEQDIALGQEAAVEIEKEVEVVDDKELTKYIDDMGQRLAAALPGPGLPLHLQGCRRPQHQRLRASRGPDLRQLRIDRAG